MGVIPIAASRLGQLGGSATTIDVWVSVIGDAESVDVCGGCLGGAGRTIFFGFVGIRIRRARGMFECIGDTKLVLSLIRRCVVYFLPSIFRSASLACRFMISSVVFPVESFGRCSE